VRRITVSDTRTPETDRSGLLIQRLLREAGHITCAYVLVKDEPEQIRSHIEQLSQDTERSSSRRHRDCP
jgi:molybdenum cofactor biosynthesis protein B